MSVFLLNASLNRQVFALTKRDLLEKWQLSEIFLQQIRNMLRQLNCVSFQIEEKNFCNYQSQTLTFLRQAVKACYREYSVCLRLFYIATARFHGKHSIEVYVYKKRDPLYIVYIVVKKPCIKTHFLYITPF